MKIIEMQSEIKKCVVCGGSFILSYKTQDVCGNACRRRLREAEKKNKHYKKLYNAPKKPIKKVSDKQKLGDAEFKKACRVINERQKKEKGCLYCERCWREKGIIVTYMLSNHHIVFRKEKPFHKYIHSILNIIKLCHNCHQRYHNKKSRRNDLMKERGLDTLFDISLVE